MKFIMKNIFLDFGKMRPELKIMFVRHDQDFVRKYFLTQINIEKSQFFNIQI